MFKMGMAIFKPLKDEHAHTEKYFEEVDTSIKDDFMDDLLGDKGIDF